MPAADSVAYKNYGASLHLRAGVPGTAIHDGPGSAAHRDERCTASGTRFAMWSSPFAAASMM
jgi:hypothetical protein